MVTEVLRAAAHFRNLPEEALERLAREFAERRVAAGETLYAAGEPVDALFVVARGTLLVFRGRGEESQPLARLCRGDLVGTADLFDSETRSETARAIDDSVVLSGGRGGLLGFLEGQPQVALNLRLAAARDFTARAREALTIAQRRVVRHRVNRQVRLTPTRGGRRAATLIDLTRLGMSLRGVPGDWQPEEVVDYRLEWGAQRFDLSGRIAWRGDEEVGIELREPSPELQSRIEGALELMLSSPI